MERSDGMILGVIFTVVGLLGLPVALLLGYVLLMVASGGFVVVALGVVGFLAIRAMTRVAVKHAYKILGLFGFRTTSDMGATLKMKLENVLAAAPATACPAACGCVRRCGDAYVGVVRIGSKEGHRYEEIHASTKEGVMAGVIRRLDHMINEPHVFAGTLPVETEICYEEVCPLGGPLKSFATTPVAA